MRVEARVTTRSMKPPMKETRWPSDAVKGFTSPETAETLFFKPSNPGGAVTHLASDSRLVPPWAGRWYGQMNCNKLCACVAEHAISPYQDTMLLIFQSYKYSLS